MNFAYYKIGRYASGLIVRFFGRAEILHSEYVPRTGGAIICANHVSYIDPPMLGWACPRSVRFMAKKELFDVPLLGWFIRKAQTFPVRRGVADRTAIRTAIESVQQGLAVAMFPEGTRAPVGKLKEPEAGAGMIVLRSGAPVIPCALINTEKLLPPHSFIPRFARVRAVFGPPVDYSDLQQSGGREAVDEVSRRIMSAIQELLDKHRDQV